MTRKAYTIGALNRTDFRRVLQGAGISFLEDKGLLDSQFVVEASPDQHRVLIRAINEHNYRAEYSYYSYKFWNGGTANEFEAYLTMFPEAEVTKHKGWFKTTFDVHCHPKLAKVFEEAAKNFS